MNGKFFQGHQGKSLKNEQCITRLRVLTKFCEFHDVDREIVTQVILTCEATKLRE